MSSSTDENKSRNLSSKTEKKSSRSLDPLRTATRLSALTMGQGQSNPRKLTVVNEDADGVIKVEPKIIPKVKSVSHKTVSHFRFPTPSSRG